MVDPALHAGIECGKAYLSGAVRLPVVLQATTKVVHVARFHPTMDRIDNKSEPGNAVLYW
jgi:hypothetical protein